MTAATLILCGATTLLIADDQDPPQVGWLAPVFALPGTVCSALAFAFQPALLLSVAIATMITLWVLQLAAHLGFQPAT